MVRNKELSEIIKVQLSIATEADVETWSSGEVTKPETINYKSHKPEADGLFDEKIFGPTKDFRCPICGKKHKRSDTGKPCTSCGESIIESKMVRRRKMGHIKLAAPVAHIWFSKVDYSVVRSVLGLKQNDYDGIIYFKSHVVISNAGIKKIKKNTIISIQNAAGEYLKILKAIREEAKEQAIVDAIENKMQSLVEEAKSITGQQHGIDFYDYNDFISLVSDVKIGTGAEAIVQLIEKLDINKEIASIRKKLQTKQTNNSLYRRLKILSSFKESGQKPESMLTRVIPVIPSDLRPLIQLDGGRHSTVDVNELYRRVIIRNNRLKQWIQLSAPSLIIQNEKRMLQEAVDALFDNTRKSSPVLSKDNRPLKSLAENLKGKQGRFRQNLLGKRVDYSGRSVIVVGPELKLHQVGLPKQMVVKLFEPYIANLLVREGVAKNIKQAKKLIDVFDNRIWKYAKEVIKGHPVLLNRAPTLHRLSIQAFEPVITSGKAIRLHPLVTISFNADFDGDQMAVHLPLSKRAKQEARKLMLSSGNILGPKDGRLILSPSQDMVLGTYYLTKAKVNERASKTVYRNYEDIKKEIEFGKINANSIITLSMNAYPEKFANLMSMGYKYIITTTGRVILNNALPVSFRYLNAPGEAGLEKISEEYLVKNIEQLEKQISVATQMFKPFKKNDIHKIIENVFEQYPDLIAYTLDELKEIGFKYSMLSGASMAINDILEVPSKENILKNGDEEIEKLSKLHRLGMLTDDQRYLQVLKVWSRAKDEIQKELSEILSQNVDNSLYMMMDSGARGNISNFVQLAGLRGSMAKAIQEYAALKRQGIITRNVEEIPIKSSFKTGLKPFEYFLSTHGARKGLSDTATKTAESGYLTRRLVEAAQDMHITVEDCETDKGFLVKEIYDTRTGGTIESLTDRIVGRYTTKAIKGEDGKQIVGKNSKITPTMAKQIVDNNITEVEIRTSLTCNAKCGICRKCYGNDLTTNKTVDIGEAVGIISAQSIGEPGTQLTMRTFHTGGVAGVSDITQGFSRLMELVDANKNPKSPAIISPINGEVKSIEPKEYDISGNTIAWEILVKNSKEEVKFIVNSHHVLRIGIGDKVYPGKKITEGSIRLQELLDVAGRRATQSYLIKEMQRLYRIQGIEINDKYMEVIIRQMLSKVQVFDKGDSNLFISQIVSKGELNKINVELFAKGKQPAFAKPIILGVRPLPLYSQSWLSAASYQRTADALVAAAISKKSDELQGIKENLIIGKNIPVGTGMKIKGEKYDIFEEIELEELRKLEEKIFIEE